MPPATPRPRPAPDDAALTEPAADLVIEAAAPAPPSADLATVGQPSITGPAARAGDLAQATATTAGTAIAAPAAGTVAAAPDLVQLGDVVPAPADVRPAAGVLCTLAADATIQATASADAMAIGEYLADLLRPATGYPLPVTAAGQNVPIGSIALLLTGADTATAGTTDPGTAGTTDPGTAGTTNPGEGNSGETAAITEGYRLDVTADGVVIRAQTTTGLFYGVQTLRQLLPTAIESTTARPGPWIIPGGQIIDQPRFAYRGAMLDVSRHFFPVTEVLRYVDHLARYKINHLHLHLTDDQGWRIAIDSWPRLASVGGAGEVDGGPGGCYSQEEYRQIVAYAAARHITIVPEIDLPGHTNAALTSYGVLAPNGVAPTPYTGTDVGFSALNVASEVTYDFVDDVLGEVAALTPGPYLHIGGDEAFTLPPDEYATFMQRVQPIVAAKGKTVMGWHQLAAAGGPTNRIIQYWGTGTSDATVTAAVRQGARVVLSPGNRTYLDMKYTEATPLGKDWAGLIEVRAAYDWDPGTYLDGVPSAAVLGVAAPLWTETVDSMPKAEYLTFPRLPAIAELGWSPASTHDWAGFRRRLASHGPRWRLAGIDFYRSPQVPWPAGSGDVPVADAIVTAPNTAVTPTAVPAGLPADSPTRIIGPVGAGDTNPSPAGAADNEEPVRLD